MLPYTLLFLAPSLLLTISLPPILLYTAATCLLIVIMLPDTGLPSACVGNRTMLGTLMQCLSAQQNPHITTTTITTTTSNVHQFMAISIHGTCLSLPADGHRQTYTGAFDTIDTTLFCPQASTAYCKVTPTAARLFIVILDSENFLLPLIPAP
jgi:hypothetical protein